VLLGLLLVVVAEESDEVDVADVKNVDPDDVNNDDTRVVAADDAMLVTVPVKDGDVIAVELIFG